MNANDTPVRATKVAGGWVGIFRLVWRTEWWPVEIKGNPVIRLTQAEAERDAWAEKYRQEHPICYGQQFYTKPAREAAEAIFRKA